jgi:predicted nucleic acid-binding protein
MTRYLLDTNILVRASDDQAADYTVAIDAVAQLLSQGNDCVIAPQVLIEFWVVATRPIDVNGLGWSIDHCEQEVRQFLEQFSLLEDRPETFNIWLRLVHQYRIAGKRVHDARLAATMVAHNIQHVLTFNVDDFVRITEVMAVHPSTILAG